MIRSSPKTHPKLRLHKKTELIQKKTELTEDKTATNAPQQQLPVWSPYLDKLRVRLNAYT